MRQGVTGCSIRNMDDETTQPTRPGWASALILAAVFGGVAIVLTVVEGGELPTVTVVAYVLTVAALVAAGVLALRGVKR